MQSRFSVMMLTKLKNYLKAEQKDPALFDLVLYGSEAKGKSMPQDIDLAVIFKSGTLKERLAKIQTLKKKIPLNEKIDIKGILWEELFQEEFFGRSGIFLEGISLFDGKPFAHKIGFAGQVIFIYNLHNKSHTQKVKFNYLLSGRKSIGIIKKLNGKHLAHGVITIPINNSIEFEEVLHKHTINYSKMNILSQR